VDGAPPIRVRAGGQVRDGVRISDIQARYIVLDRDGKLAELALVKPVSSPEAAADSRQRRLPTLGQLNAAANAPASAPPAAPVNKFGAVMSPAPAAPGGGASPAP
jgi:hypothetical protein